MIEQQGHNLDIEDIIENEIDENQQNTPQDDNTSENENAEETASLEETLNNIEPAAFNQPSEVVESEFSSITLLEELEEDDFGPIDAIGALGQTEQDFANPSLGSGTRPVLQQLLETIDTVQEIINTLEQRIEIIQTRIQNIVENINTPEEETPLEPAPEIIVEEPTVPEATILVSNATKSQTYINNNDHYALEGDKLKKTYKVDGEEMDINGVADDVRVHYKFKSEDTFHATMKADWNDLKNIEISSEDLNTVRVKNFVHADVSLTGDDDKNIRILDAKRGFIDTDGGDDKVFVKALSNGSGWSNTFDIETNDGNDTVTVKGSGGHTLAVIDTGAGNDTVKIRGDYEQAEVDLGLGDDKFNGRHSVDIVEGGLGNDNIRTSGGNDIIYGGTTTLATALLTGTQIDISFVKSQAGYKNTFGLYEIGENGEIQNVTIVYENMKGMQGDNTQTYTVEGDANLSTFIIANGYNQNGKYNDLDMSESNLHFIYNYGQEDARTANIADDANAVSLVYNDGETETVLKGHIYHETTSLNKDGKDHVLNTDLDNDTQEIAYEDLYNLGDRDYTDAVVTYQETDLYDLTYTTTGSDNDTIRSGKGNDIMVGGAGDDILRGGQDIDIAVFMGSIDEYIITQKGNRFTIEDTVEGRDGTDMLYGVEGLLFGMEDLYLDIVQGWSTADINDTFGVNAAEDLDLSNLVEDYDALQTMIDNFVHHEANTNNVAQTQQHNSITDLAIYNGEAIEQITSEIV